MADTPITQAIEKVDESITIICDECGWKSDPFKDNHAAFEGAQDHEDIEHEGSTIKWEYNH